jgi:hypothetical protein
MSAEPSLAELRATNAGGITYSLLTLTLPDAAHEIVNLSLPKLIVPYWTNTAATVNVMRSDEALGDGPTQHQWSSLLGVLIPGVYTLHLVQWDAETVTAHTVPELRDPTLTPAVGSPGGQPRFLVHGVPGLDYVVQSSSVLSNWVPFQTNLGAPFTFESGTDAAAFYRVEVRPLP